MVIVFSWIKRELMYIKDSFFEIIKGLILVILASTGLGCAILLRYLGFNGTIITLSGVITEIIALLICYFLFQGYLKPEENSEPSKPKGKN